MGLVTLPFDRLTLELVRFIARGVGNLHTNVGVSGTSRSRVIEQHVIQTTLPHALDL